MDGAEGRELYDHQHDPREQTNLAGLLEHAGTVAELASQLQQAIETTLPSSGKSPRLRSKTWVPSLDP